MATEKRLIDANALREKLQAHHDFFVNAWGGFSNLPVKDKARVDEITNCIAEVVNATAVDAVEVVRCKDCRTCAIYDDLITRQPQYVCRMARDYREVEADGFCSRGERRKPDGLL